MTNYTYYGFRLKDAFQGLKLALQDETIPILSSYQNTKEAGFTIQISSDIGDIILNYCTTTEHPLGKLGKISVINVSVDDNLPNIKTVLTLAFLRGGG